MQNNEVTFHFLKYKKSILLFGINIFNWLFFKQLAPTQAEFRVPQNQIEHNLIVARLVEGGSIPSEAELHCSSMPTTHIQSLQSTTCKKQWNYRDKIPLDSKNPKGPTHSN